MAVRPAAYWLALATLLSLAAMAACVAVAETAPIIGAFSVERAGDQKLALPTIINHHRPAQGKNIDLSFPSTPRGAYAVATEAFLADLGSVLSLEVAAMADAITGLPAVTGDTGSISYTFSNLKFNVLLDDVAIWAPAESELAIEWSSFQVCRPLLFFLCLPLRWGSAR